MLTPELTHSILLMVQALHLLHHRLAKRHVGFVEVSVGVVLCIPVYAAPALLLMVAHLGLASVQVVGSIWIDRLSPKHDGRRSLLATLAGGPARRTPRAPVLQGTCV